MSWEGIAQMVSVKRKTHVKEYGVSVQKVGYLLMDSRNVRHWHVTKVKPNGGLYYMFAALDALYGGTCIAPSSGLSGLLQMVVRRARLTVCVVLTTDHAFL